MKYETYIKNISEAIKLDAGCISARAVCKGQTEEQFKEDLFFVRAVAKDLARLSEYLKAPKSFVEKQPRGMKACKIGKAWIEHKSEKEKN